MSCAFRVGEVWWLLSGGEDRPFIVVDSEVKVTGQSSAHLVVYLDDGRKGVLGELSYHPMEQNFMFKRIM